ncbi:MAG: F0F1 ATP synthase subunit delta [Hyphomicrobiales bacterium]|nr:F0F1 ATP synthase subunit delta [Hyphomicrobiales bacterium]
MTETTSHLSGVAGRYAGALFDLATETGEVDAIEAELARIEALLGESEDLRRLVRSPVFSAEQQLNAISAILDKMEMSGTVGNFVRLVAKNRRLFALSGMIAGYRRLAAAHRGEASADITTAAPLSDANMAALKEALKDVTGKDVNINAKVDPALLGGLIVRLGSRMIDTSLRSKLNSLKTRMKEVG